MTELLLKLSELITLYVVIPLFLIIGLYLSFRLYVPQVTKLKFAFRQLLAKNENEEGSISNFEAISTVLAGNLGTGNISGMAVALATGGPGAIFWMWIMAFLGMIIKYASCLLALKYRHLNTQNEWVGGPMYYLKEGLKTPRVAVFFCIFAITSALTVGNFVQVNSLVLPLAEAGYHPLAVGIAFAIFTALIIIGGLKRIASFVTKVVPGMTVLYLGAALIILARHHDQLSHAFFLIFHDAFTPGAVGGGAIALTFMRTLTVGFNRGIFATDAGLGMEGVFQSSARTKNPKTEGLVAMTAPVVVMIVCTITVLVLIVTGAWQVPGLHSTNMCTWAFREGLAPGIGEMIIIVSLLLFSFTTIIAWAFCAEKAVEYLFGLKAIPVFNYCFILCIPFGAIADVHFVWAIADISVILMLCTNMVGIVGLTKQVVKDSVR